MIKTFLLIFNPGPTWEKIVRSQRGIPSILFLFVLPLMIVSSAIEIYGITHWNKQHGELEQLARIPLSDAIDYALAQFFLSMVILFAGAQLLKALGETFHARHTYLQSFTTIAYSLAPLFLFRLLQALPVMNWWMPWTIGILVSLAVLYHGLPRVLQPDPTHALGLFFISAILLVMITFLGEFIAALVLKNKFHLIGPLLG